MALVPIPASCTAANRRSYSVTSWADRRKARLPLSAALVRYAIRGKTVKSDALSRYLPEGDLRSYPDAQTGRNLCTEAVTQGHTRSMASSPVALDRRRCNTPHIPQLQTISVALPFLPAPPMAR